MRDVPALAQSFWDNPPDAAAVAAWWKGLSKAEQDRLIRDAPTIIGNLNCVPYSDRSKVNKNALDAAANDPNLTQEQKDTLKNVRLALNGLKGGGQR